MAVSPSKVFEDSNSNSNPLVIDCQVVPSSPTTSDYDGSSESSVSLLTGLPPLKKRRLRKTVSFGKVEARSLSFSSDEEDAQDGFDHGDGKLPDLVASEDEEPLDLQNPKYNNSSNNHNNNCIKPAIGNDNQHAPNLVADNLNVGNFGNHNLHLNNNNNNNNTNNNNNNGNNFGASPFSFQDDLEINIGHERNLYVSSDGTYVRFALRNAANVELFRKRVHLSLRKWKVFVEAMEDMDAAVKNLVNREDVNFFLHLGNKIHVSIKTGIYCIDIRRYWFPRDKDELVHGFPSISMKLRE